jgi:molybdopterin-guanine dinucleotide biosynthesis protein A
MISSTPHMNDLSKVTLAVLAGGAGSRMGRPKGELTIGGTPILRWLLERWRWGGPTLLVTAPGRERPPGCEAFDREVSDAVAGAGPLRGLATALSAARTPMLVVATCDMPRVEERQFRWLAAALLERRARSWMIMTRSGGGSGDGDGGGDGGGGGGGEGEIEPFPCAIQRAARKAIDAHLAGGARSLHSLATLAGVEVLAAPRDWPADAYTNLNHPDEYDAFLKAHRS